MASRTIEVIIGAKDKTVRAFNALNKKLKNAKRAIANFRKGVAAGFGMVAKGVGTLAAAIGTVGGLAVKAFAKQESAVKDLTAAIKTNGGDVDKLIPRFQQLAAAIQNETGAADEATLALMAQIKNLGVVDSKLEEATKGAIGLAKALRLDQASAARYAALALNGEFTILQRYVPALRSAKDETEKMAIVQELMARGYEQAQEELDTTAGRFAELKGRIGDAAEVIGEAIAGGDGMKDMLAGLADAVKNLTDSGRLELWAENVKRAIAFMSPALEKLKGAFGAVKEGIQRAAAFAGGFVGGQGGIRERIEAGREMAATIPEQLKEEQELRLKAIQEEKRERQQAIKEAGDAELAASKIREDALATEKAIAEEKEKAAKAEEKAAKDREKRDAERLTIERQIASIKEQHAEAEQAAAREALNAQNARQLAEMEQELFAMTPEGRRIAEAEEERKERISRLQAKEERGIRLSRRDKEFLEMEAAKAAVEKERNRIQAEQERQRQEDLAKAQKSRDALLKEVETQNAKLNKLLQAAG